MTSWHHTARQTNKSKQMLQTSNWMLPNYWVANSVKYSKKVPCSLRSRCNSQSRNACFSLLISTGADFPAWRSMASRSWVCFAHKSRGFLAAGTAFSGQASTLQGSDKSMAALGAQVYRFSTMEQFQLQVKLQHSYSHSKICRVESCRRQAGNATIQFTQVSSLKLQLTHNYLQLTINNY